MFCIFVWLYVYRCCIHTYTDNNYVASPLPKRHIYLNCIDNRLTMSLHDNKGVLQIKLVPTRRRQCIKRRKI